MERRFGWVHSCHKYDKKGLDCGNLDSGFAHLSRKMLASFATDGLRVGWATRRCGGQGSCEFGGSSCPGMTGCSAGILLFAQIPENAQF